jgi:hypothetical protein
VLPACTVAVAGETDTDATGAGGNGVDAVVVADSTIESAPNTASKFRVPRNAINWKSYLVEGLRPITLQTSEVPIVVPAMGTAQLPLVADVAEPQAMGGAAYRISYFAG